MQTWSAKPSVTLAVIALWVSFNLARAEAGDSTVPSVYANRIGSWPGLTRSDLARTKAVVASQGLTFVGNDHLAILDTENVQRPIQVAVLETPGSVQGLFVVSNIVYVADGESGLQIVDVREPSKPRILGGCDTLGFARQVVVTNGVAYVADSTNGLVTIDVRHPEEPKVIGGFGAPGWVLGVEVVGSDVYLANWTNGVVVVDCSDPRSTKRRANYSSTGSTVAVVVAEHRLFVAKSPGGLEAIDIRRPDRPIVLASFGIERRILDVSIHGAFAYGLDYDKRLLVLDVSTMDAIRSLGEIPLNSSPEDVYSDNRYLYLAGGSSGLRIFNAERPPGIWEAGGLGGDSYRPSVDAVATAGHFAYVADNSEGLRVLDISDFRNPKEVSGLRIGVAALDVAVNNEVAFVLEDNSLSAIDIKDPRRPSMIGTFGVSGAENLVLVSNTAYIGRNVGVDIVNVSNSRGMRKIGHYGMTRTAKVGAVSGQIMFVMEYNTGIDIVDISSPGNPHLLRSFRMPGFLNGVVAAGDVAYVSNGPDGVQVLDVADASNPRLAGHFAVNGSASSISMWMKHLCVMDSVFGLQIVDVSEPYSPRLVGSWKLDEYDERSFIGKIAVVDSKLLIPLGRHGVAIVEVALGPTISEQPSDALREVGESVVFEVVASGTGPIGYTWLHNGVELNGATNAFLRIDRVQIGHSGEYRVVARDDIGTIASSVAVLTVRLPLGEALGDTAHVWRTGGEAGWFSVPVDGLNGMSSVRSGEVRGGQESWIESTFEGPGKLSFWTRVLAKPADRLELSLSNGGFRYWTGDSVSWLPCEIWIPEPGPVVVRWRYVKRSTTTQEGEGAWLDEVTFVPLDRIVRLSTIGGLGAGGVEGLSEGGFLHLKADLFLRKQAKAIRYQWFRNGKRLHVDPRRGEFSIDMVQGADGGEYSVTVIVEFGDEPEAIALHSDSIHVEVRPGPQITSTPGNPVVLGSRVVMSVEVQGGSMLSGIQWYAPGWWPIVGATESTLILPAVTFEDAGEYRALVAHPDGQGSVYSSPYRLAVLPAIASPKVVTQPEPQVGYTAGRAVFSVGVSGTPPFGYRWYKGNAEIADATNFFLVLTNINAGDAGSYRAVVSNPAGSSTSSTAALSLVALPTADGTYESWVALGRAWLTNRTAPSLANAVGEFSRARDRFPGHPDANLLLGIARFFDLAHRDGANAFLDRMAFSSRKRDLYDWGSNAAMNGQGEITAPPDVGLSELSTLIRDEILPVMLASGTNLAAVASADFLMRLTAKETTLTDVWLDRGDVLTLRAGLKFLEFLFRTVKSWDVQVPLAAIEALLRDPSTTIEAIRSNYPGLLTFEDSSQIGPAKAALEAAVDLYVQAAGTIRSRPPGSERLFNVWREDEAEEERLRQALLDLKASIAEAVVLNEDPVWRIQLGHALDGVESPRQLAPAFIGDYADPASVSSSLFRGGLGASGRPRVIFPPIDRESKAGGRVELGVVAVGSEPLQYEWRKEDRVLFGATTARLLLPALSDADVGLYSVLVRNAFGEETLKARVSIVRPPTLLASPNAVTAIVGGGALLRVEAAGAEPLRFQWYRDGEFLPGETNPDLHLRDVRVEDQATYVARISNAGGEVFTTPAAVAVAPAPGGFSPPLFEGRYDDTGFGFGLQRTLHDGFGGVYAYYLNGDVADSQLVGSAVRLQEADGFIDLGTKPFGFGGHIGAMAMQPDGKLLVAALREGATVVTRFVVPGQEDPAFRPFAVGRAVRFITVQPDGRILLAATDSETPHPKAITIPETTVLRLHSDGTLDGSFHSPTLGPEGTVLMLYAPPVVDSEGRIYIGGTFRTVDGQGRTNLARLQPDGRLDLGFLGLTGPAGDIASSQVRGIGIQSDGKIVVAGDFRISSSAPSFESLAAIRFLPSGEFDASFARTRLSDAGIVAPGMRARAMLIQPDDRIILVANTLVRLGRNGALDQTMYQPRFGAEAYWVSRAADGRLFVPGLLSVDGESVGCVAAFTADGRPDRAFQAPRVGRSVFPVSLASLPGNRLVVGGHFNTVAGHRQLGTAILESDGRLAFRQYHVGRHQPTIQRLDDSVVTEGPDGTFYCLETLQVSDGTTWNQIHRIRDDGEVDDSFHPELTVTANLLQGSAGIFGEPDGSILVVGGANALTVAHTNYLWRLLADGRADPTFRGIGESLASELGRLKWGPDNFLKEIVAGSIRIHARDSVGRYLASVHAIDGTARVARLLSDGTEDATFAIQNSDERLTPQLDYADLLDPLTSMRTQVMVTAYRRHLITDVLPLSDGRILVSGRFSRYGSITAAGLVCLLNDGTLDMSFSVGTGPRSPDDDLVIPFVDSLGLDGQGRIFAAGRFSVFGGISAPGVVRLASNGSVDPDFRSPVRVLDYDGVTARLKRLGNRLLIAGTVGRTNQVLPSGAFALDVAEEPAIQKSPPAEVVTRQGERVLLTVEATGRHPITFQWQLNGSPIPGAVESTLTFDPIRLSHAGRYTVVVRDAKGEITSPISVVRVLPRLASDSLTYTQDGHPTLSFDVLAGARVIVEASDDLRTWKTVVDLVPARDRVSITDFEPTAPQGRFYRAKHYLP